MSTLAASLTALLAPALAAAVPAPTAMTPTGPWNVEFADSMCLLSRPYGPNRSINLILKPSMIGDGLEIIVTKATTSTGKVRSGKAALTIAGRPVVGDTFFTAYSTPTTRLNRIWIKDDLIALSAVRGTLTVATQPEDHRIFDIPGIERALPVLSTCLEQLRAIYKVSEADLAAVVTKPQGGIARVFSTNDYPAEALAKGQFGTVGMLLRIEANGRVSNCQPIESSAGPTLQQTSCNIMMRRGRFTPAKDIRKKPVPTAMFTRVRWELPAD